MKWYTNFEKTLKQGAHFDITNEFTKKAFVKSVWKQKTLQGDINTS